MKGAAAVDNGAATGLLAVASSAAFLSLIPVAAFQCGLLQHLPDPPFSLFDSEAITSSRMAHPLGVPDALLGLSSYGATLSLVALSSRNSFARKLLPWKIAADGSLAAVNFVRQALAFRKLCSWCSATAMCTGLMLWAERQR